MSDALTLCPFCLGLDMATDDEGYCLSCRDNDLRVKTDSYLLATPKREASEEMYEALITALPYVEMAELDEAYQTGVVKKVTKQLKDALARAEEKPHE